MYLCWPSVSDQILLICAFNLFKGRANINIPGSNYRNTFSAKILTNVADSAYLRSLEFIRKSQH